MAICKKNQATVSQKHTKDSSQLSNEDDDVLSREQTICKQHHIQKSWLNIIGLNRPLTNPIKLDYSAANLIELGHFFAAIAL